MKTHLIYTTKDYDQFESNQYQQPTSDRHIENIAASIQKHGYLHSKPIQVYRRGKKFVIVDGHHRFHACKMLGIEVLYVIESEKAQEAIGDENVTVKKWANSSFVSMYAQKGNRDYVILQQYTKAGISLGQAAAMLVGQSASSTSNVNRAVRTGEFKVKTTKHIDAVLNVYEHTGCSEFKKQPWVDAISKAIFVHDFDVDVFVNRARANPSLVIPVANSDQALEQLDAIYNFRSHKRINIAFLAKESAKNRKANFGRVKSETK